MKCPVHDISLPCGVSRCYYSSTAHTVPSARGLDTVAFTVLPHPTPTPDELRKQVADLATELAAAEELVDRQSRLLDAAVNELRGPPPENVMWSHHDVAQLAQAWVARVELLKGLLAEHLVPGTDIQQRAREALALPEPGDTVRT